MELLSGVENEQHLSENHCEIDESLEPNNAKLPVTKPRKSRIESRTTQFVRAQAKEQAALRDAEDQYSQMVNKRRRDDPQNLDVADGPLSKRQRRCSRCREVGHTKVTSTNPRLDTWLEEDENADTMGVNDDQEAAMALLELVIPMSTMP